ncbi:Carboxyl-terminal-processing peptidase 1, chloroplastic [Vitis vinifera]|uniref:Carboxyl-terminal-processing peptidase 1, chloroplastic n=1 Tax=Vitis vinifera TaxID=29760 RepID=A0A438EI33_VITVI|nr:Carboxyl-terminal-processing peptidase 1, chloroplastic [Vitis vinifera]
MNHPIHPEHGEQELPQHTCLSKMCFCLKASIPHHGDEILSVNGMDVTGKSAFEASSLLQGPNETFVTLEVKHGNCGPVQSIEVQRQLVARTPVFYRLEKIENGAASVGYMRLKEFNALARKDLVIAMKRLQDMGAKYFILDLRDNLGGLVQAGIGNC